jgi:hypothetical protein
MLRSGVCLCVYFLILSSALRASDVEIGGLRKVRATVGSGGAGIICEVSFTPVSCFNAATNQLVNQRKAREYALLAMAKNAGVVAGGISATDLRPISSAVINGDRLTQTFEASGIRRLDSFPKDEAPLSPGSGISRSTAAVARSGPSLLSCMDDMQETLKTLADEFDQKVVESGRALLNDDEVAGLESAAEDAFGRFESEVKRQSLLLQLEKQTLITDTQKRKAAFLKNLKAAYEAAEKP